MKVERMVKLGHASRHAAMSYPDAERAELAHEIDKFGPHLAVLPFANLVFQVGAVGLRILRYDKKLLDAGTDEAFGLAQDVRRWAGHQITAQFWDDAEGAATITTL